MKVGGFLELWGVNLNVKGWSQVEYLSQTYQPGSPRASGNAKVEASGKAKLKPFKHQPLYPVKKYGENCLANLDPYFI